MRTFEQFLQSIFESAGIQKLHSQYLLNHMDVYRAAFTHKRHGVPENYEYLEFLGDSTLKCCMVWYMGRRFPELQGEEAVMLLSRLKIKLESRAFFAVLANSLGIWDYVNIGDFELNHEAKCEVLEDVLEAFFGATMMIGDTYNLGAGYTICYKIYKYIMDQQKISLKYEDVMDATTRLKELFDYYKLLGACKLVATRFQVSSSDYKHRCEWVWNERVIGAAEGYVKAEVRDAAAQRAIDYMKSQGYDRPINKLWKY